MVVYYIEKYDIPPYIFASYMKRGNIKMIDKYNIQQDISLINKKVNEIKSPTSGVSAIAAIGHLLQAKAQLIGVFTAVEQIGRYDEMMKNMDIELVNLKKKMDIDLMEESGQKSHH